MTSPFKFRSIAFEGRQFEGPYSESVVVSLTAGIHGTALDIGCGKGTALKATGLTGVGIDINPSAIEVAKQNNPRSRFYVGEALEILSELDLTPDLIINLGASQAIGSPAEALAAFARLLKPGGHLLFGDGVWDQEPSAEYLSFLGAKREDLPIFPDFLEIGEPFGLRSAGSYHSTQEDWDSFEDHYYYSMMRWCDANTGDPDEPAFREKIEVWRKNYLELGRGVLGFAIVLFERLA